jgi:hypothetical protein
LDKRASQGHVSAMPTRKELLDLQFIDARSRVLDVAAFLDRMDRHSGDEDPRLTALRATLPILLSPQPGRAKAILEALSDTSVEMPQSAPYQGATGAPPAR